MFNSTDHLNTPLIRAFIGLVFLGQAFAGQAAYAASAIEQGYALPGIRYHGLGKPLHVRNPAGALATVRDFLAQQGWTAQTLDSLTGESPMPGPNGQTIVELEQSLNGLRVYGAQAKAVFDAEGNLVELNGALVETRGFVIPARIAPLQALNVSLSRLYPNHVSTLKEVSHSDTKFLYGGDRFFSPDPKVSLVAVPEHGGAVAQGFVVELWSREDNQLDYVLVNREGQVLEVQNRTADDSYNVFTATPSDGFQQSISGPAPVVAPYGDVPSPAGWLYTSLQDKQFTTFIQGNNVRAYLDRDKNNSPDTATVPVGLDGNFIFNSLFDATKSPIDPVNQAVAVQNLFYFNNTIHDELYGYGFNESWRNFQADNLGRGGMAADPVNAEAQDGGGTNNANFATPNDGSSPRMQMYLWNTNSSSPNRDGDVDGDIVWHEYGHGLTWRVIGNMSGLMGGALGEGASDALAIVNYDDDIVGEYSYNDPKGIRTAPYDGYEATGRTYESICAGGCEVHRDGEIFAAIIWDMWDRYIAANGNNVENARNAFMNDYVGGMQKTGKQCSRPTFPSIRDGILNNINGSTITAPSDAGALARWCATWKAFAKFGVGLNQSTTCTTTITSISWSWYNGFKVPDACDASQLPSEPGNLTATAKSTSRIDLRWADTSSNEEGFRLERCKGAGCSNYGFIKTLDANATAYSDINLVRNSAYSYRIRAYTSDGSSGYSPLATAKTFK